MNLCWVITEPGSYRITVYVRRVGYSGKMLALPGANCDSYKESVAFTIKPREITMDKEGEVYGSKDPNAYQEINSSLRVTAKEIQMLSDKNETIELKNLATGTLRLNFPGMTGLQGLQMLEFTLESAQI